MREGLYKLGAAALIAATVFAFYRLSFVASRGGEGMPLYSSRRFDPYGTAAFRETFSEIGIKVRSLEDPRIADAGPGVLVQVLPVGDWGRKPWSRNARGNRIQTEPLREWIAEGNTLVQFTRGPTRLMRSMGVRFLNSPEAEDIQDHQEEAGFPDEMPGSEVKCLWTDEATGLLPDYGAGRFLLLVSPQRFSGEAVDGWTPLAVADGFPAAAQFPFGKGKVIIVGAPTPILNGYLNEGNNLDFMARIVGDGPVIIDEWSHGIGSGGTIMSLLVRFGLIPVLLQIIFILALNAWRTRGHRRPDRPGPRSSRPWKEQIGLLAHLYSRTLPEGEVRRRVREEVLRRLSLALRRNVSVEPYGEISLSDAERADAKEVLDALEAIGKRGGRMARMRAMARAFTASHSYLEERNRE